MTLSPKTAAFFARQTVAIEVRMHDSRTNSPSLTLWAVPHGDYSMLDRRPLLRMVFADDGPNAMTFYRPDGQPLLDVKHENDLPKHANINRAMNRMWVGESNSPFMERIGNVAGDTVAMMISAYALHAFGSSPLSAQQIFDQLSAQRPGFKEQRNFMATPDGDYTLLPNKEAQT